MCGTVLVIKHCMRCLYLADPALSQRGREVSTLTPTLSRKREREKSLSLTSKEEKQKAANPLQD